MMLHQSILTQNSGLRPTFVEINLAVLTANYQAIQRAVGERKVMVVVKANAYGHGLVRVAQHLQGLGVAYLAVAYLEEAVLLRQVGITVPILVLGGIALEQIDHFIEYDVTITA
ncbi:MAG TPA: alanine racemase, partial [Anaerolineae bacterium]|nr:alanine racemase [Anaerolineae bacterium]